MPDIFLSYSRDDRAVAQHFAEGFERAGFSVWWDVTLNAGEDYDQITEQALRGAKAVVVLWSAKSVASRWVRTEATIALQSKTLVPVMITPCQRPIMFELTQTADLCHWQGDASDSEWLTFLSDVQRFVQRGASSAEASAAQLSESLNPTPTPPRRQPSNTKPTTGHSSLQFWRHGLPLALLLAAVTGALVWFATKPQPVPVPLNRFVHSLEEGQLLRNSGRNMLAVSPDGRRFVYNTSQGLMLRELSEETARLIAGTEATTTLGNPVFSPDGQSLIYWGNDNLRRIAISGGAEVTLATGTAFARGASWSQDGNIWFGSDFGIYRVSANGGTPELVLPAIEAADMSSQTPELLPDGEHVLYTSGRGNPGSIVVQSLRTGERKVLIPAGKAPHYLASGHLTYVLNNSLLAVAFDAETLTVADSPVPLVQGIVEATNSAAANYAISNDGTLMYLRGNNLEAGNSLAWVDASGREEAIDMPTRNYPQVRVSPDGSRFAASVEGDIWVGDLTRGLLNRITNTDTLELYPVWTPDAERLVFSIGNRVLSWTTADGTQPVEALTTVDDASLLSTGSWTPDQTLLFTLGSSGNPSHLGRIAPYAQQERPLPWEFALNREHGAAGSAISPDGRWLVYQANDSGKFGVYIERYPELGGRQQLSDTDGGWGGLWSTDGSAVFYRRLGDGAMMRVSVTTSPDLRLGTAELLFNNNGYLPLQTPTGDSGSPRPWDIAPDGRFLMLKPAFAVSSQFVIVQNWIEELKRQVPVD